MKLLPFRKRSSPGEALSAYVDGGLEDAERADLERRLEGDPELRRELEDLQAVKRLVASLQDEPTPRSFALGPEFARSQPAARMPVLSRVAFGGAAAGLIVAAFATYAIPDDSYDSSISALPAADGTGTIPGEGQSAAPEAAEDAAAGEPTAPASTLAGTPAPPRDASRGVERSAAPDVADLPAGGNDGFSAESAGGVGGAVDELEGSPDRGQEEKSAGDGAPETAPFSRDETDERRVLWRAVQAAGLILAAAAAVTGGAVWFRRRAEV